MKLDVIASTKPGYQLSKDKALEFSGHMAGICYMPDTVESLFREDIERTRRRALGTLKSGHHSVFGHVRYNLAMEGIPKILAMVLNNEKIYDTSEKSARYTKMQTSAEEKDLYEKWIKLYIKRINEVYPQIGEKQTMKLAQENARYLISVFTPTTTMGYSVDLRQLNYLIHWNENFIKTAEDSSFNLLLKPVLNEFNENLKEFNIKELNTNIKGRKFSLFADRTRNEEWGENYCVNYYATFAQIAQAQRHRTLYYEVLFPEEQMFFVPYIIKGTNLEEEWIKDIKSLAHRFPQGMMLCVNERGTVEKFIEKCNERLCGYAQLEIAIQTEEILKKYLENTKSSNLQVYEYLLKYSKGARCTFPNYKCAEPCMWGPKNALIRKI